MADIEDNMAADSTNVCSDKFLCGVVEGFYGRPWTSDQRKDLFNKMRKLGLNSYLYAPKDDCKHRMFWRDTYSVEETENMRALISSAKEYNITFYYALSPGIDITYSSTKDITALKRKLEQVSQLGCNAFALLFDDIEPEMGETDKEIFQSFAHAQVSVSNEVFQHLGHPKFMFCPTEYCASRAVPNVLNSEYLNVVGSKLFPSIDIMWTGPKVISETITLQSIQELTQVFRRPPVIWDNIHANDYDHRRLFLGPYSGRSPDLIPLLKGVLTNPNCEYESNFIAFHTLAQWSKSSVDGKRNLSSVNDSVTADIKLETQSEDGSSVEDIPSQLHPDTYHPRQALKLAINDWIAEFDTPKDAYSKYLVPAKPLVFPTCGLVAPLGADSGVPLHNKNPVLPAVAPIALCLALTPTTQTISTSTLSMPISNSLAGYPPEDSGIIEPMDCNLTPPRSDSPSHPNPADDLVPDVTDRNRSDDIDNNDCDNKDSEMQVETNNAPVDTSSKNMRPQLTYDDLSLLVDMFYLPYEHGHLGIQIMMEFQWLKSNANGMVSSNLKRGSQTQTPETEEWVKRATKFNEMNKAVASLLSKLTTCQNRSLLYDIYPYIWDIKGIISLLNSYVKWLAGFSKGYKEAFLNGDQESWVFRGGLTGELQRLLPLEGAQDLFLYKLPDHPVSNVITIRPYLPTDEESVYKVCRSTCDDGSDGTDMFPDHPDLVADKCVGGLLVLSPEFCFVIEDDDGVCGYALASIDAQQHYKKQEIAWLPQLCGKYPLTDSISIPVKEIIAGFHAHQTDSKILPETIVKHHPSLLGVSILHRVTDGSVPKRLLACVMSALKANGSCGVFAEISTNDKRTFEFYNRLGFLQVSLPPGSIPADVVYLGRTF